MDKKDAIEERQFTLIRDTIFAHRNRTESLQDTRTKWMQFGLSANALFYGFVFSSSYVNNFQEFGEFIYVIPLLFNGFGFFLYRSLQQSIETRGNYILRLEESIYIAEKGWQQYWKETSDQREERTGFKSLNRLVSSLFWIILFAISVAVFLIRQVIAV